MSAAEMVSIAVASVAALAALGSWRAARQSATTAKQAINLANYHEKNRIRMVKNHHEMDHMKRLVVTFAEFRALAASERAEDS